MGCLKLTYYQENEPLLKCVWNKNQPEKAVQWFYTVDPICELKPNTSNVIYCSNNPINLIDPDGRDDWEVNNHGETKKVKTTKSKTDNLYSVGENGQRNGNMVKLKKGLLESKKESNEKHDYDLYNTKDRKEAAKFFEFVASNSEVEWGQLNTTDRESYLSTSCNPAETPSNSVLWAELENKGKTVLDYIHSHPYYSNRSYFGPSTADNDNVKDIINQLRTQGRTVFPTFKIFHPSEGYIKYNSIKGQYEVLDIMSFARFRPGKFD